MSRRYSGWSTCWCVCLFFVIAVAQPPHVSTEGHVALLISFGSVTDPDALSLSRSFKASAKVGDLPITYSEAIVASPFEAAQAAREFMDAENILLVVVAGDEGSTVATALLSNELHVPVLKLTSDEHSFADLSEQLFEFLPSCEAQGECLAAYAVIEQQAAQATVLTPDAGRAGATARGFCRGMQQEAQRDPILHYYSPASASIKQQLVDLRDDFAGFQEASDSQVVLTSDGTTSEQAVFFFALPRDRIESYAAQMTRFPGNVQLYGNAGWLHRDALGRQSRITENMYIVAPLLPEPDGESDALDSLQAASGASPTEWELLGIDAGNFVGKLLATKPSTRREMAKALQATETFHGIATRVDFRAAHENRNARIVQFDGTNLIVIR